MAILLLRHGSAGTRETWGGDDDSLRPLDAKGLLQAAGLATAFDEYQLARIASSPTRRCVETVEPLAARRSIPIEERAELAEGVPVASTLALLRELDSQTALVCTHGDVIAGLIGADRPCRKGSVWILEPDGAGFAPAVYLPSP
jgi:8-oxo-(d)GTP phosphatase